MTPRIFIPLGLAFAALICRPASTSAADSAGLPQPRAGEQWSPVPPVIDAPAGGVPSDATVLFDGRNLDAWTPINAGSKGWQLLDGAMVIVPKSGYLRTKAAFGDIQLHLEFREPAEIKGAGQGRGNSGVYFMGIYELQILDSYKNPTYVNGQAASIYKQYAPLVNASRPPGEWQSYDAVFIAPRFAGDGRLLAPARATVFHNGVLVQYDVAIKGPTAGRGNVPRYFRHPARLPLELQDHGDKVSFRNIWVRELNFPAPDIKS